MDSDSWNNAWGQLLPQRKTFHEITWITWKTKQNLEIWPFLKTRLEQWVWESGPKIDPATGVTSSTRPYQNFSKGENFCNKFSRKLPLKRLCQHFFHQITTPPRSSLSHKISINQRILYCIPFTLVNFEGEQNVYHDLSTCDFWNNRLILKVGLTNSS